VERRNDVFKSSGAGRSGAGRGSSAIVDVVQRRQADRLAKVAFLATWATLTPAVFVVGSAVTVWWLAAVVALAAGFMVAILVGLVVLVWPGLRLVWYWAGEITALGVLLAAFWGLSRVLPWPVAAGVVMTVVGVPLVVPGTRRWLLAWCWVAISRHRLRTCFATFIRANRYGSLPWMLVGRPTPAGERLWVWLRPGLSLEDLTTEGGLGRLAVGCWACEVRIHRASRRTAALLRVDITRRNPLARVIVSPLPARVPDLDLTTPVAADAGAEVGGLDLPDVSDPADPPPDTTPTAAVSKPPRPGRREPSPTVVSRIGEDLSEWV
jgi:hypothetical protein